VIRVKGGSGLVFSILLLLLVLAGSGSAAPGAKGTYIVVLKGNVGSVPDVARDHARRFGGDLQFVYTHALTGYAVSLPEAAAAAIARLPMVDYVESDGVYTADATESPVTWGLDRIDQRSRPLSNSYTYTNTGAGVTAYIIDTGIRFTHTEFAGGRATTGYDAVTTGGYASDCNGHGTHVAGTVGGTTYGVAKDVSLVAVRVLDCNGSGTTAQVVAGIDWVTANHPRLSVANMSLGGSTSTAIDTAVRNSINSGVSYSIAAGNGFLGLFAQNACNTSPARVTEAMTVSATDSSDKKPSWANVGTCVDWFAPGLNVTSAWNTNDTATNTISGTSMATPHTTGVAALYLQATQDNPAASAPAQVQSALRSLATSGVVVSPGTGSPNKLLFTNY
jgi:subtilisin family serine protease